MLSTRVVRGGHGIMSPEKPSAEVKFLKSVEPSPPDMYVEEEFTDVDGTSPSSMMRQRSDDENVNLDKDREKGGTVSESIVNITIETASADHHHEAHDLSGCRICLSFRVNDEIGDEITEMIDLGCACKSDLSRAHKVCATKWFEEKGHRCCEICHRSAKSIPISEPIRKHIADMELVGCGFWLRRRLIALVLCWVAVGTFLYKVDTGVLGIICGMSAGLFSFLLLWMPPLVNTFKTFWFLSETRETAPRLV